MRIADGIDMLEIAATVMGRSNVIYPTLLRDEEIAVLVDTGYPGQAALLREAMAEAGVPLARLRAIILTHLDIDHVGNAAALQQEAGQPVEILAGAADRPYIQGEHPSPRFTPARAPDGSRVPGTTTVTFTLPGKRDS
jgi:glyoxylase-like metal-dependent hydrolase (beta-lactamase superfamily II)